MGRDLHPWQEPADPFSPQVYRVFSPALVPVPAPVPAPLLPRVGQSGALSGARSDR